MKLEVIGFHKNSHAAWNLLHVMEHARRSFGSPRFENIRENTSRGIVYGSRKSLDVASSFFLYNGIGEDTRIFLSVVDKLRIKVVLG